MLRNVLLAGGRPHERVNAHRGQLQWGASWGQRGAGSGAAAPRNGENVGVRNPVYAFHEVRIESWSKFVSEAYWNVELEK